MFDGKTILRFIRSDGKIYQRLKVGWKIWEATNNRRSSRASKLYKNTETIRTSLEEGNFKPITIKYENENEIKITSTGRYEVSSLASTLIEDPWYSPSTSTVGEAEKNLYLQKIAQGEGSAVCDGSYKNGR